MKVSLLLIYRRRRDCIYSGDPNQDGIVDGADGSLIDTDAFNIVSGSYITTDLDADGIVDAMDYAVFDNNAFNFIGKVIP